MFVFMFKGEVSFKYWIFNSDVFALLVSCPNFLLPAADTKTFLLPVSIHFSRCLKPNSDTDTETLVLPFSYTVSTMLVAICFLTTPKYFKY